MKHNGKCYIFWREKPKGHGVIIIPCDKRAEENIENQILQLREIFDSTTESEETIDFIIEELDLEHIKTLLENTTAEIWLCDEDGLRPMEKAKLPHNYVVSKYA